MSRRGSGSRAGVGGVSGVNVSKFMMASPAQTGGGATGTLSGVEHAALTALRPGQVAVIREIRLEADDAALLRAMGLCVNATLRVFRVGSPCVVAVGGVKPCKCGGMCRVGLARALAGGVYVELKG